jgi:Ca2+-binding RTX toxin-like protein
MNCRRLLVVAGGLAAAAAIGPANPASAAVGTPVISNQVLSVKGDAAADKIAIRLAAGQPGLVQIDRGDDGSADFTFDGSRFTKIAVDAGGGNDAVRIDETTGKIAKAISLAGGAGNDTLAGSIAADSLNGGDGDDVLAGGFGPDTLSGGAGADRFEWAPGGASDKINGGADADLLHMTGANVSEHFTAVKGPTAGKVLVQRDVAAVSNELFAVEKLDVDALGGNDVVASFTPIALDLDGGDGDDLLQAFDSADALTGGPGNDVLAGGGGKDSADGGDGNDDIRGADRVTAGAGDDTIRRVAGEGSVLADGGAGDDTFVENGSVNADRVTVAPFTAGEVRVARAGEGGSHLGAVEKLQIHTLSGNDTIEGAAGLAGRIALDVDGGAGDDAITGGDGADLLEGSLGNDTVRGGGGDDRLHAFVGEGLDEFEGGDGNDVAHIDGTSEGEAISLGRGVSSFQTDVNSGPNRVRVSAEHIEVAGNGGADHIAAALDLAFVPALDLDGGDGNDTVIGGPNDDFVSGDAGDDTVRGDGGSDSVDGGDGDDQLFGGSGFDRLLGGAGADFFSCGGAPRDLLFSEPADTISADCG